MEQWDVIIIGAGGAGMMAAIEAGKRGRRVMLLDHAAKIGAKILISGGGRCNFTNTGISADRYVSQNPDFCRSALTRYTADDFIALVEKHNIRYHEKKLGQLFCDLSAKQILEVLIKECKEAGAFFHNDTKISSISKMKLLGNKLPSFIPKKIIQSPVFLGTENNFFVKTSRGDYQSPALVIATGGLSIPKIGATGFGYDVARQFGLKIVPPSPALDGFVFDENLRQKLAGLTGVALDTIVTCNNVSFRENILFTHSGLSGPAALQASLYWNTGDTVTINFLPDVDLAPWFDAKKKSGSRSEVKNLLLEFFPKSFSEIFCRMILPASIPLSQISQKQIEALCQYLTAWKFIPTATVGFSKAEVTRGGVSTDELSSKTMESKKVPGLYFIGEVVDVTGWLGGYNFQWAWSSGWVAGQYV